MMGGGWIEVGRDQGGDLIAEADAVVRAAILGIDLRRVGEVEAGQAGAMVRDTLTVVERNDWLSRALAEDPRMLDPGALEVGVDAAQVGNVGVDQLVITHGEIRMIRLEILGKIDEPLPA